MEYINNAIGIEVPLQQKTDGSNKKYYTGMLQFPGTLDFNGIVFMVFLSEEGYETLQISCLAKDKPCNEDNLSVGKKVSIDLDSFRDSDKNVVYIAKIQSNMKMPMKDGLFFTVFNSIKGREQIQISPLRAFKQNKLNFNEARKTA